MDAVKDEILTFVVSLPPFSIWRYLQFHAFVINSIHTGHLSLEVSMLADVKITILIINTPPYNFDEKILNSWLKS